MRALATVARVGEKQQQPEAFKVNIAELEVAAGGQQASSPLEEIDEQQGIESIQVSISRGCMKENVLATKNDVKEALLSAMGEDKVTPEEEHMLTSLASVKLEAAITIVEDAQALDVEDISSPVVAKGDEPVSEEEQASKLSESVETDTLVIEKVKGVSKPQSLIPPRRRCRSFDLARVPDRSPAASSIQETEDATGGLRQSLTIDAALSLNPMTAGALETWPASPRDVPLSWSSAMRALATVAWVEWKQPQQLGTSEVEIAEVGMAVGSQQTSISLGSRKKENVAMTKSEVEKLQALVIVGENSPTSAFPLAEGNESVSPESTRPKATVIGEKEVEDVQSPPTNSEQSAKLEATEKTVVDTQTETSENQLSSAEVVEGDEFPILKKHASTSPEIIDTREAAVIEIVEGGQAFDVDKDMAPSTNGGELPLKEARDVQEPAVEGDNYFSAISQKLTCLEAGNPKVVVKEEVGDSQLPPAVEGDEFSSAEVDEFPSKEGRAPTSPASVLEKKWNDQAPDDAGCKLSLAEVQGSASPASVKTQSAMKERREKASIKALAVTGHGLPTEGQPSSISPASVKTENKVGGIPRPVVKGQEKPARPSLVEKATPLATVTTGPCDVKRNRAERKSRQAMAKLGLRAVSGVFRVSMKASNGDLLVVEKPDVFKHPQQAQWILRWFCLVVGEFSWGEGVTG